MVGIRGGVGIIGTHQVFIGFGQGTVTSGSSSVTLDAGEYTAAGARRAADATRASAARAASPNCCRVFQSQAGQGGGAPASPNAINQARAVVTGSSSGPVVAMNLPNATENQRQPPQPQSV